MSGREQKATGKAVVKAATTWDATHPDLVAEVKQLTGEKSATPVDSHKDAGSNSRHHLTEKKAASIWQRPSAK